MERYRRKCGNDQLVRESLAVAKRLSVPKEKGTPGHPTLYRLEYARIAEAHCRLGATQHQLADSFGVATRTIEQWLVKHKEFHEAVHRGLFEGFSPRVVRSLADQAVGYAMDVEETKVLGNGHVVKYTTRKYVPPNVTACIFWLKNRQASDWRDVRDHVVEHQNLDKLSPKELLDEIRKEAAELGIIDVDPIAGIAKLNGGTKH